MPNSINSGRLILTKFCVHFLKACQLLRFLAQWETRISDPGLDFAPRYQHILHVYGSELERIRDIYEAEKHNPQLERGVTPTAGRIRWARALLQRIREPLDIIRSRNPSVLEVQ